MLKINYSFTLILLICFSCTTPTPEQEQQKKTVQPILLSDFSSPEQVWTKTSTLADAPIDTIRAFPNGQIELITPEVIKSPIVDIDPLQYYQLDFEAEVSAKTLWAMVFFDQAGNTLLADIYSSFEPTENSGQHTFYFQSKIDAVRGQFWLRPFEEGATAKLKAVSITKQEDHETIISWADSIYATIPPLAKVPTPTDRMEFIPKSMQALENGEKLSVVMLGNSIINDTGNSAWELLVEAAYPGADMEVITSVRGGTGCWYYQEENRVESFVLRYQPDLLIIGGISHKNDTAAIHNVINQVRAKSDTEILVFTGPVGRQGDPRTNPEFTIPPQAGDFRLQLQEMAQTANVGYWDMQTEWGKYIQASDKPYDFFLRDPVHANARGRQVLARLMAAYFAPKNQR